jgi:hypothetical protein
MIFYKNQLLLFSKLENQLLLIEARKQLIDMLIRFFKNKFFYKQGYLLFAPNSIHLSKKEKKKKKIPVQ